MTTPDLKEHQMPAKLVLTEDEISAERERLAAARARLFAGTPVRSAGGLSAQDLAIEAGFRNRQEIYRRHRVFVQDFVAEVGRRDGESVRTQELVGEVRALQEQVRALKAALSETEERCRRYEQIVVELDLKLHARSDDTAAVYELRPTPARPSR